MTVSEGELRTQLAQAYSAPLGPTRFAALDTVFRNADAAGYTKLAFDARLTAVRDFYYGGDPSRAFLAFSWCLAALDRDPDLPSGGQLHTLLWRFKWIVACLPEFPDIPLDRTQHVLDDMQRRYLLAGHSLHAVFQHRWLVAHHIGDLDGAEHWYRQMLTARRDGLSDCRACVPSSQVKHLTSLGRYEEAVEIGAPVARGGCDEQPHWILSELLLPYLHTGRLEQAAQAHQDAYRRIRSDRHHLDNISAQVLFCAVTGNEEHGLEIVERHIGWLERPHSPFAAMQFASAAALVLRRLAAAGKGDLTLRRRSEDGARRWASTVVEAFEEMAAHARGIAARFDARNGNTHQGRRVEARIAAQPIVTELPLTVRARVHATVTSQASDPVTPLYARVAELTRTGDETGAARAWLDLARALRDARRLDDAAEAAEEAVLALDRSGVGDGAVRGRYLLWEVYRAIPGRRSDAFAILDQLITLDHLPEGVPSRAALLEQAATLDHARAWSHLLTAADLYHAQKQWTDEIRTLGAALTRARQAPTPDTVRTAVIRLDTLTSTHPDPDPAGNARSERATAAALHAIGDINDALDRYARAVPALAAAGHVDEWSTAALAYTRLLLHSGRVAESAAQARQLLADDSHDDRWSAASLLVTALRRLGQHEEAEQLRTDHDLDETDLED
ncbi:MAG: hypothetical protein AUG44_21075 [Actinobacteria bacterium 13_1_20CM_3_71_11]|nr:MAG: hypothetical protein AUG44_21075 [Actinobacteria bacterium 13_1_20CM_3_71_11]